MKPRFPMYRILILVAIGATALLVVNECGDVQDEPAPQVLEPVERRWIIRRPHPQQPDHVERPARNGPVVRLLRAAVDATCGVLTGIGVLPSLLIAGRLIFLASCPAAVICVMWWTWVVFKR